MRAAPAAIDALEQAGLRFELLDGFLYPGHRARRMHTLRQRSGQALMAALGQAAADAARAGADAHTGARAAA